MLTKGAVFLELDKRKELILETIVESYIKNAEPVGSRTIAKSGNFNLSPATIRNEMADLESMGLLEHPHTSAGRVPSELGYRLYVDRLMKRYALTHNEIANIRSLLETKVSEIDSLVKEIVNIYSRLTDYTFFGLTNSSEKHSIRNFQVIPFDANFLLVIIVTDDSSVKNKKIKIYKQMSPEFAGELSNFLNNRFTNLLIDEFTEDVVDDFRTICASFPEIFTPILHFIYETIDLEGNSEVFCGGSTNLLNFPEYSNIDRAKELLSFLNDSKNLKRAVSSYSGENIKIYIGSENNAIELQDCSLVLAPCKIGDKVIGTIGLIGPTRLNYSKAVSNIEFITSEINKLFISDNGKE